MLLPTTFFPIVFSFKSSAAVNNYCKLSRSPIAISRHFSAYALEIFIITKGIPFNLKLISPSRNDLGGRRNKRTSPFAWLCLRTLNEWTELIIHNDITAFLHLECRPMCDNLIDCEHLCKYCAFLSKYCVFLRWVRKF